MTQRYEREIEEILVRLDKHRPRESWTRRLSRSFERWRRNTSLPRLSFSPASLMIGSLVLAVMTFPLRAFLPQMVGPVSYLSLILFIVGLVMAVTTHTGGSGRGNWRGQTIEFDRYQHNRRSDTPRPWDTLWRRIRRWRKTRHWSDRGR